MASMDITHDRAGYMICWGCLLFLPVIYTSHTFYLVAHPVNLGTLLATTIFVLGAICIWINYDCDRQRADFRKSEGRDLIWGKPAKFINA